MLKPAIIASLTCLLALEPASAALDRNATSEAERGRQEALKTVEEGRLHLESYAGARLHLQARLRTLLERKYGITVREHGCMTLGDENFLQSYNAAMTDAIIRKFGRDVVADEAALFDSESSGPLHDQGAHDAQSDIARGQLKLFRATNHPCHDEIAALLKAQYTISTLNLDWMDDHGFQAYASGYNSLMWTEIARRFGKTAIDNAEREASAEWRQAVEKRSATNLKAVPEQLRKSMDALRVSVENGTIPQHINTISPQ